MPNRMPPRRAVLFVTCIVDQVYPGIGFACAELLERQRVEVEVLPELTCCGQMAFNAGYRDEARNVAARAIELLAGRGDVVMPSGSCAAMLRHSYAELFAGTSKQADAAELAHRTYEITEYLVDVLGVTDVGAQFDGSVAYHHACHGLRVLGLGAQAMALLAKVRGARVAAIGGPEECCGFGGLFSIKQPAISEAMLMRKMDNAEAADVDVLVTGDASCMTHIAGGLSRRGSALPVRHIAELLANRLGAGAR
jgi:L-lactate dehydrogenase complex protein LldE